MDVGSRDEAMTAPLVQIAKQGVEARDWSWVEGSVWTDRMLSALGNGVKGGVWYSLMDKVYAPKTLAAAWAKVQANDGAAGVDRQSIERFAANAEVYLASCRESCGRANTVRRRSGAWRSRKGMAGCDRWGYRRSRTASPRRRSNSCWNPSWRRISMRGASASGRGAAARMRCGRSTGWSNRAIVSWWTPI